MRSALFALLLVAMPLFAQDDALNDALIECADAGDPSALALLRERYEHTATHEDRLGIARAVLDVAPNDDTIIWRDVFADAERAVQFATDDDLIPSDYFAWCAENDVSDAEERFFVLRKSLGIVKTNSRARSLLLKALETNDDDIIALAVWGLAEQRALETLPAIESAIARMRDPHWAVLSLSELHSERTDELATKYLNKDDLDLYYQQR